jgi:hypothetical protein
MQTLDEDWISSTVFLASAGVIFCQTRFLGELIGNDDWPV